MIGEFFLGTTEAEYFFRGEFVFALTMIDFGLSRNVDTARIHPLWGLYLYFRGSSRGYR